MLSECRRSADGQGSTARPGGGAVFGRPSEEYSCHCYQHRLTTTSSGSRHLVKACITHCKPP